jgi:hypothetical protein
VARLRHAYEQAMLAYPVAHPARAPDESPPSYVRETPLGYRKEERWQLSRQSKTNKSIVNKS